jgi:hypothetical protein
MIARPALVLLPSGLLSVFVAGDGAACQAMGASNVSVERTRPERRAAHHERWAHLIA